jgi:hypothetical protein
MLLQRTKGRHNATVPTEAVQVVSWQGAPPQVWVACSM